MNTDDNDDGGGIDDDDDTVVPTLDWEETAYFLPQPPLFTEESFNENVKRFSFAEYFTFMRESNRDLNEKQKIEKEIPPAKTNNKKKNDSNNVEIFETAHQKNTKKNDSNNVEFFETAYLKNKKKNDSNVGIFETAYQKNKNKNDSNNVGIFATAYQSSSSKISCIQNDTIYHLLFPEPRHSNIKCKDRRFFHSCMRQGFKVNEIEEDKKMKELLGRVHKEQNEYQQFLHESASKNIKEYIYLHDSVNKLVTENNLNCISKVLQPPLKLFKLLRQINMIQLPTAARNIEFSFVRRVHEEGDIPTLNLPKFGFKMANDTSIPDKKNGLSEDTIMNICMNESPRLYMKHASLIAIMEGLVVISREWLIPLAVKEVDIGNDQKQKVLIFSDPLPRRSMTTREVNDCYYQHVLDILTGHSEAPSKSKNSNSNDACSGEPDDPGESLVIDIQDESMEESVEKSRPMNTQVNLFSLEDLTILFETKVDQYDNDWQKTLTISAKCEYQYAVGFEQFSMVELCHLWWDSKISNSDFIISTRIDIRNDVVLRNEQYNRDTLCSPGCPYNPTFFYNHIYYLLQELLSLDPGQYFLEHAAGNTHVMLFRENVDGMTSYETKYKDIVTKKKSNIVEFVPPWLPIDTNILPDKFMKEKLIPCLFSEGRNKPGPRKKNVGKGERGRGTGYNRKKSRGNVNLNFSYAYPDSNKVPIATVTVGDVKEIY